MPNDHNSLFHNSNMRRRNKLLIKYNKNYTEYVEINTISRTVDKIVYTDK